jgi:hypothetical protein
MLEELEMQNKFKEQMDRKQIRRADFSSRPIKTVIGNSSNTSVERDQACYAKHSPGDAARVQPGDHNLYWAGILFAACFSKLTLHGEYI